MINLRPQHQLDIEKAIEAIVFVAARAPIPDIYHVGKILYFADRRHLEDFGRLIFGDRYVAMKDGPVPSAAYDLIKDVRDSRRFSRVHRIVAGSFSVEKGGRHLVTPLRDPNLDCLSESDVECLEACIAEFGELSFSELKRISHDTAYDTADLNDDISFEALVDSLPSGADIKEYIQETSLH